MFDIAENTDFLTAIGIADADEETKATLIAGLNDLVKQKLTIKISDLITDEQAEEFGKITDEKEAQDWLMTNIPNFPDLFAEAMSEIKNDLLARKAEVMG